MKKPIHHDRMLNVRLPTTLAAHATEVAKAQGMNISTFTRQAIRRNIDLYLLHERHLLKGFTI
jgi:predicted HicB family RNase H-like nuclease